MRCSPRICIKKVGRAILPAAGFLAGSLRFFDPAGIPTQCAPRKFRNPNSFSSPALQAQRAVADADKSNPPSAA